jgi:uncharacterized HAD superfamily protein
MTDRQIDTLIEIVKEDVERLRERYSTIVKSKTSRIGDIQSILDKMSEHNDLILALQNHKKEGKVWT